MEQYGENLGDLGVWYNPLTWFDGASADGAVRGAVGGAASVVPGGALTGELLFVAQGFFNGRIANGLEKEKSEQHARYRELRDNRFKIFQLSGGQRARAETFFRETKATLDAGTARLNSTIAKHDDLVQQVKEKAYLLAGTTVPDLQKVRRLDPPVQGLSGLTGQAGMGALPILAGVAGVGAWVVANPVSFAIVATAMAVLTAFLATYFFIAFSALVALLGAMVSGLPLLDGTVARFKSLFSTITAPAKTVVTGIVTAAAFVAIGLVGFAYFKNRKVRSS